MFLTVDGVEVNYECFGSGDPVILLPGWGADIDSMRPVLETLGTSFAVYAFDLPGFGCSPAPPVSWGVADYQKLVSQAIRQLHLQPVFLVGHSFGGRIALCLAAREPNLVKRLALVASAGIKPKRTSVYYIRIYTFKAGVWLLGCLGRLGKTAQRRWGRLFGSSDYRVAGSLKGTFVKVVNEDLTPLLEKILVPTLLVWGEADTATPLADGLLMNKLIPDSRLLSFPLAGHYAYLECLPEFCKQVTSFFKEQ